MAADTGTIDAASAVAAPQAFNRVSGAWFLAMALWWTVSISLISLAMSPGEIVPGWLAVPAGVGFVGLCALGIVAPSIRPVLSARWPEMVMFACVTGAAATAAFATTLHSLIIWFFLGSAAFAVAAFALLRIRRHPIRSLGLIGGYVLIVLLFVSPLNDSASSVGLRLKLEMVEAQYRSEGEALLLRGADARAEQERGFATGPVGPANGRVVLGPTGEPTLVAWTWTDGLLATHPYGLVFDPDRRIGDNASFDSPMPDGTSLRHCESIRDLWWWCAQYD